MLLGSVAQGEVRTSPATRKAAPATQKAAPATRKPPPQTAPQGQAKPGAKYTPATPEQIKMMEEFTAEEHQKAEKLLKISLKTIETAHFHIVTDWDPREYQFLKDHLEAAYAAVSGQFGIPTKENIFIGKMTCFVFSTYGNFQKFSASWNVNVTRDVQAYYKGSNQGYGFMVVQKPGTEYAGRDIEGRKMFWKYVVTHEITHAFVARYISNRPVDTWLNEGIAEVIASSRYFRDPMPEARDAGRRYRSLSKLFDDDDGFRSADMYPVMRTLTEVLVKKDKKAFLKMFDEIKQGKSAQQALKDNYNMTFEDLEALWRRYVGA